MAPFAGTIDLAAISSSVLLRRAVLEVAGAQRAAILVRNVADTLHFFELSRVRPATTDADVQLAVLIAAAFSMYNRMVEGFRARTAPTPEAYRERAGEIATHGYGGAPVASAER